MTEAEASVEVVGAASERQPLSVAGGAPCFSHAPHTRALPPSTDTAQLCSWALPLSIVNPSSHKRYSAILSTVSSLRAHWHRPKTSPAALPK
eukprot:2901050-Rhodomonas_salina.1